MANPHDSKDSGGRLDAPPGRVRDVPRLADGSEHDGGLEPAGSGDAGGSDSPAAGRGASQQQRAARVRRAQGSHRSSASEPTRRRPAFGSIAGPRWWPWAVRLGGLAAAATAVVVVLVSSGASPVVSATRAAELWKLPATSNVLAVRPGNAAVLDVSFHGTEYPNYHDREGWHAVGTRPGSIDGTPAFTVYYATGARRAAYTVVEGVRVALPSGARRFVAGRTRMAEFRDGDRWVVVFSDHGNSCVLVAAAPREKAWLVKLAAWHRTSTPD